MSTKYTPRSDSLAAQVCGFFANNPDESLTIDDIMDKFMPASRSNIHTQLGPALEAKLLARRRDDDLEYVYSKGAALNITGSEDAAQSTPRDPAQKTNRAAPRGSHKKWDGKEIDSAELRYDVPKPKSKSSLRHRIDAKLLSMKVGASFVLPICARATLQAAMTRQHKAGKGQWSAFVDKVAGQVGCWCDARSES